MSNVPVARRYARALLDAAGAEADQLSQQLESLASFFEGHRELFDTISSPTLTRTQRMNLVEAVIANAPGLSPMLGNLLKLLADRGRFSDLLFISRQFRDMVDSRMGRVRGTVTSAAKLGDAQIAGIKKQLEALTQRSVVLETRVDPSLLGGVIASVGSHQYDGSIRSHLDALKRELTAR